jgi:hypothetical protein
MDAQGKQRLVNLCRIFNIRITATEPDTDLALAILSHLYAMPLIKDRNKRTNYGNQILQNTRGHFEPYSEFVGRVGTHMAMMQVVPHWYANLSKSTAELVEQYKDIERCVYWLNKAGWGGAGGAAAAGVAEYIKEGSVKAGAKKAANRVIGKGAIAEALEKRYAAKLPKAAGVAGVVLIAGGTIAYYGGLQAMEDIKAILIDRFQKGDMTDEQYRRVFGDEIDPTLVKKYWEM